ncbi:nidogen-like domain-containing protein [Salinibacterium sp. TMP30]|uniref:nidogen-like domain-containing protein n=1 Tax=Salinibacterium sp. TMP30 TaxID=3138237 RepID=UPI003139CB08
MKSSRVRSAAAVAALAAALTFGLGATAVSAAGPGYGDVSDAMVYGASAPVGTVLSDLIGQDDDSTTVAAPFAINFFGTRYEGLCISTNGSVYPVLTPADGCSDDYDVDVESLALSSGTPVIAVLANDLDPSEDLWVPGVGVASVEITGGVATITTSTPHPFIAGDTYNSWFAFDDPSFAEQESGVVVSVPTPTSFTFATALPDEPVRAVTGATVSIGNYDDVRDDTNADGLADDGFGAVKQIYEGTTTIDGKPAVVITWYRVPTNDTYNSPLLSNTFQIVLIQEPTANAAVVGYDFTIQINIGTATENDDGYSAADPTSSCDADPSDPGSIDNCRWGVGWANYDTVTATADAYELFAAAPINTLIDSAGTTALVNNRLNSAVLGRYTWKMVGGVTVGFAIPTLNGADAGTLPAAGAGGAAAPAGPQLAATGTDSLASIGLGAALVAAGGIAVMLSNRRRGTVPRG